MLPKIANPALEVKISEFLENYKNGPQSLVEEELKYIKYKKNFSFYANFDFLQIIVNSQNSEVDYIDDIQIMHIIRYNSFNPIIDSYSAKDFIYEAIKKAEEHEIHEFLKFDNKHFINPHPELINYFKNLKVPIF